MQIVWLPLKLSNVLLLHSQCDRVCAQYERARAAQGVNELIRNQRIQEIDKFHSMFAYDDRMKYVIAIKGKLQTLLAEEFQQLRNRVITNRSLSSKHKTNYISSPTKHSQLEKQLTRLKKGSNKGNFHSRQLSQSSKISNATQRMAQKYLKYTGLNRTSEKKNENSIEKYTNKFQSNELTTFTKTNNNLHKKQVNSNSAQYRQALFQSRNIGINEKTSKSSRKIESPLTKITNEETLLLENPVRNLNDLILTIKMTKQQYKDLVKIKQESAKTQKKEQNLKASHTFIIPNQTLDPNKPYKKQLYDEQEYLVEMKTPDKYEKADPIKSFSYLNGQKGGKQFQSYQNIDQKQFSQPPILNNTANINPIQKKGQLKIPHSNVRQENIIKVPQKEIANQQSFDFIATTRHGTSVPFFKKPPQKYQHTNKF